MAKKKMFAIILVVVLAIVIVASALYFLGPHNQGDGAFEITIPVKDRLNIQFPDLPLNTFKAGQSIKIGVFVGCNDTSEKIRLIASDGSVPVSWGSQAANVGNDGVTYSFSVPEGSTQQGGAMGFGSTLTVTTSTTTPQGYYTITIIGANEAGTLHMDTYQFSLVN